VAVVVLDKLVPRQESIKTRDKENLNWVSARSIPEVGRFVGQAREEAPSIALAGREIARFLIPSKVRSKAELSIARAFISEPTPHVVVVKTI
jgi:hypothetical protein